MSQDLEELRQRHVGRLLLRAHRAFSVRAAEMLHDRGYPGVALRHIDLLPHIDAAGTRATVLARRAGMTKQGMGKLVAELEERGLVERAPDPTDGRAMLVRFTGVGMDFLEVAVGVVQDLEREYLDILGEERLRDLKESLDCIVEPPYER
ncbi:MAG TPA: MarR family transcriptional regulator [Thermomicrobiales bacterium]|nr:MarR family transcriptional regulator [Thermomicrobiales bacterium]